MRLAIVTPFPDKERKQLTKMSAVAQYSDMLLSHTLEEDPSCKVTVFTEMLDARETYQQMMADSVIEVDRCYKSGNGPFRSLLRRLVKRSFDIVHIQHETFLFGGMASFFAFPFFVAAVRLRSIALVTLHHVVPQNQINGTFLEIYQTKVPLLLIKCGFQVFYRLIGRTATGLVVHEEYFKEVLQKDYGVNPDKVKVIAHGVIDPTTDVTLGRDALKKEFSIPDDAETIFGFFGYISKYKGLDYLIEEFIQYLKTEPKGVLLIAGALHPRTASDPAYVQYVESLKTAAQGAGGRIIWFGPIDTEHVPHFYKLVDCIVLPYKQTTSASSVLSCAIGSETAFLVSESLKPTVRNAAVTFGLYEHALEKKLGAFSNRNLHTESSAQIFVEDLKKKRVWPVIARKTISLYSQEMDGAEKKSILIAGAYGQSNLGDEYMLDVCLRLFGAKQSIVLSTDPRHTVHTHGVASVSSRKPTWRAARAFLDCSTVVVGGGDQFKLIKRSAGRSRYSLLIEMALLAVAARIWRKKLMFLGIGIGNISSPVARFVTKRCLRLADTVTLRDEKSYETAVKLTKRTDIVHAADLTFMDVSGPRNAQRAREKILGIAPAYEIEHPGEYARIIEQIGVAAQKRLDQNPSLEIKFLPFQPSFHEHTDVRTSHEILQHIIATDRCSVESKFSKDSINQTYLHTDVLWGVRLHSLVFACIHSVPFIALVYDEKIRNFLREIGMERWSIELDETFTAEKLLALHGKLLREMPAVINHLNEQKTILFERANLHMKIARLTGETHNESQFARLRTLPLHPSH